MLRLGLNRWGSGIGAATEALSEVGIIWVWEGPSMSKEVALCEHVHGALIVLLSKFPILEPRFFS